MEINNFVDMEFLAGFAGTILGVELIVYCTKELPIINKIPTRIYTFMLALIHLLIVKIVMGTFILHVGNVYLLIINSLLISAILCGGYDIVLGNIQMVPIINGKNKDGNRKTKQTIDAGDENIEYSEEENTSLSNRGINSNINNKINQRV